MTLNRALEFARAMEISEFQAAQISGNTPSVHRVHTRNKYPTNPKNRKPKLPPHTWNECKYCGRKHEASRSMCPASGQTCDTCKKKGHFAAKCLSTKQHRSTRNTKPPDRRRSRATMVQEDEDSREFAFKISSQLKRKQ